MKEGGGTRRTPFELLHSMLSRMRTADLVFEKPAFLEARKALISLIKAFFASKEAEFSKTKSAVSFWKALSSVRFETRAWASYDVTRPEKSQIEDPFVVLGKKYLSSARSWKIIKDHRKSHGI